MQIVVNKIDVFNTDSEALTRCFTFVFTIKFLAVKTPRNKRDRNMITIVSSMHGILSLIKCAFEFHGHSRLLTRTL